MSTALVLSGGAARGPYEVGVLRYVREELAQEVGRQPRIDLVTGTSVGAIHAAFVAGTAHDPANQGKALEEMWLSLRLEDTIKVRLKGLGALARRSFSALMARDAELDKPLLHGLLTASHLVDLVTRSVPWDQITRNIDAGHIDALSVSAYNLTHGTTNIFVQRKGGGAFPPSADPRRVPEPAIIGPEHVIASSAMPFIFPAVQVGNAWYCDGGIRQNTPLSPALRMGATKVMVIALTYPQSETFLSTDGDEAPRPGTLTTLGRLVGALLLDSIEYDLKVLRRTNALLETASDSGRFHEVTKDKRGTAYRPVDTLLVRPSQDIGMIAARFLTRLRKTKRFPRWFRSILDRLEDENPSMEANLMSYLLFDREYAEELIELGMHDARAQKDELIDFLF